jgi:hypothetical protein
VRLRKFSEQPRRKASSMQIFAAALPGSAAASAQDRASMRLSTLVLLACLLLTQAQRPHQDTLMWQDHHVLSVEPTHALPPPDVKAAEPNITLLWPAEHLIVSVLSIQGVKPPPGASVKINITGECGTVDHR